MRSFSLSQATRPTLFYLRASSHSLPPRHISSRTYPSPLVLPHLRHGRRSMHWQSALSTAIEGTQSLIVELHTVTGLPWFLTIPLVAFTVGTVSRLPFTLYTQRILRRRTTFTPLLQAWNARIQQEVVRDRVPVSGRMSETKARQDKILRRIYRKLGLQEWRLYSSILSFPVWLIAIDGVRRLCGGPRGLIGSLVAGWGGNEGTTTTTTMPTSTAAPEGSIADLTPDPAVLSAAVETSATVDPSLTIEGCLWFTDLSASDPYHVLPLALSCTLLWNLMPSSRAEFWDRIRTAFGRPPRGAQAQTLAADEKVGLGQRARGSLYVGLVALATMVGPLTLNLPAALHLYWLTSSATHAVYAKAIRHFMPVNLGLQERCKGREMPIIQPPQIRKN
ncbi:hypothetical protein GGR51DRAFT_564968 [Nemania sp. FL0031]|nr:hypothetical protein GGR51DRAFT_564968 [Nemania sp. FL0031]